MSLLAEMRASIRTRRQQQCREDQLAFLLSLQERSGRDVLTIGATRDAAVQEALVLARSLSDCGRKLGSPDLELRQAFLRLVETSTSHARRKTGYVTWVRRVGAGLVGLSLFGAAVASAGAELGVGNFELPHFELPSIAVFPESEDGDGADQAPVESIAPVSPDVSMVPAETHEAVDAVFDLLLGGEDSGPIARDLPEAATRQLDGDGVSPAPALTVPVVAASAPVPADETEPAGLQAEDGEETPETLPVPALSWFPGQGNSSGPAVNSSASPHGTQVYSQSHAGEPPKSAAAHATPEPLQAQAKSQAPSSLASDRSLELAPGLDLPQDDEASCRPGRAMADCAGHDRGKNAEDDEAPLTA
jgi:hypothetical protein